MVITLGGFHQRVMRWITGQLPQKQDDGSCNYSLPVNVMREAGMEEIDTYIYRRQNTADKYIVTLPILDLFLEVGKRPGERVVK